MSLKLNDYSIDPETAFHCRYMNDRSEYGTGIYHLFSFQPTDLFDAVILNGVAAQ